MPAKERNAWFLNSSKSKTRLKFMKLGMLSWSGINTSRTNFVPFGAGWVYASHKPELLTKSMMVFGRERPIFGDETISVASYCFQNFLSVNIEQQECCVIFCDFSGSVGHFMH